MFPYTVYRERGPPIINETTPNIEKCNFTETKILHGSPLNVGKELNVRKTKILLTRSIIQQYLF
jgi:hypothetical protein